MKSKLSIVIVNWNTGNLLKKCLKSIKRRMVNVTYEVFVVDNASSDESVKIAKKFKWVRLIENNKNLGFSKANNQAIRKSSGQFILLLNPDTLFIDNSVTKLLGFLETRKDVAACGPKLLNPDKSIQKKGFYRRFPGILQTLFFYTDLHRFAFKRTFLVKRFWETEIGISHPVEVDQIPGACLLTRRKLLEKLGFLDEDYPIWFEDVDLCWKLKKLKYKLYLVPESRIMHIGGAAFDLWQQRVLKESRFWRSFFLFFDKNKSMFERIVVRLIIKLNFVFLIISRAILQIFNFKKDRQKFIFLEIRILKNLFFS